MSVRHALQSKQPDIAYVILRQVLVGRQREGYLREKQGQKDLYLHLHQHQKQQTQQSQQKEQKEQTQHNNNNSIVNAVPPTNAPRGRATFTYTPTTYKGNDKDNDLMHENECVPNIYADTDCVDEIIDDLCYVRMIDEAAGTYI